MGLVGSMDMTENMLLKKYDEGGPAFIHPKGSKELALRIKEESALNWLKNGAQPSDSVRTLFTKHGLMAKLHDSKKGK